MSIGDCSRKRRFSDPARRKYYATYRTTRFARFLGFIPGNSNNPITAIIQTNTTTTLIHKGATIE